MRFALIALVAFGTLSVACDDSSRTASLEKRADDLDARVKALESSIETVDRAQKSLQASVESIQGDNFVRDMDAVAYLTPGSEGYSTIQTDLGRLTVKLANVQPNANGTRVTLRFGNLLNAAINGVKATLEWGSVDEKGLPRNESTHSREFTFTESLRAGAWTNVPIVLEGVPPTALGFVRVKEMTHTGISLAR